MLRRLFTENLFWKVISLVFAVVLWWYVATGETVTEVPKSVAVELRNPPENLLRTSDIVNRIEIRAQGPRGIVEKVKSENLRYVIDLANAQPGEMTIKVYASRIENLPPDLKVTEITPSQIKLYFEERIEKKNVPVAIEYQGTPARGFELAGLTADPAFVDVTGAKAEVKRIRSVPTDAIDVTGAKESFDRAVGLDLMGRYVDIKGSTRVNVRVEIKPQIVERRVEGVRIRAVNTLLNATIQPPTAAFTVRGPLLAVETMNTADLSAYADAAGLGAGTHRLRVRIDTPQGVDIVDTALPEVTVDLRAAPPAPANEAPLPDGGG